MASFHHVFIAVMGMTGSGKSTFIKTVTGKDVKVGHTLHACTEKVEDYVFQIDQYIVHLIDTPGFDDTSKSDTETLAEVAIWLANSYRAQIQLTGILYLHRITDNRLGGCAMKNLKMFKKMCGRSCLPNVVFLTTMWGSSAERVSVQENREQQLKTSDEFWAGLLRLGGQAKRYDGTAECGIALIKKMLDRPQIVLDIQRQIVDEGKNLNETAAGIQLGEEIAEAKAKFKEELRKIKEEMTEALKAKDVEAADELKKYSDQLEGKLKQMESDRKRLEEDLQKQIQNFEVMRQKMSTDQKIQWIAIGVGVFGIGALTGGLGLLGGMALAGTGGAAALTAGEVVAGVAALKAGQLIGHSAAELAGELGRRAVMSATQGAAQLGSTVLEEAGPQLAAQALASRFEEL